MTRGIQRTLSLTEEECQALVQARDQDRRPYFGERCAAVLKVAAGQSARQVALQGLYKVRDPETVCDWLDAYERGGVDGLVQRPRGHRGFSPSARRAAHRDGAPSAGALRGRPCTLAAG